jgi:DNA ligase (NAD+)
MLKVMCNGKPVELKKFTIEVPTRCPSCGELLVNNEIQIHCVNEYCDARIFQRIMNFIKVTKIDGFGEALVEKLWALGKLRSISDIFLLKQEDIANIEGWGERSAGNILTNLALLRYSLDPVTFLASMGIPSLSTSTAEDLWKKYGSIPKIMSATVEDISTMDGYSNISAKKIVKGLEIYWQQIHGVLKHITLQESKSAGGKLAGQSFCFTGEMSQPRSFFQNLVTKHGGKNDSTVTKTTTYLVCNENKGSSKSRKAEQYGVKIINEQQFMGLIEESVPKKLTLNSLFEE